MIFRAVPLAVLGVAFAVAPPAAAAVTKRMAEEYAADVVASDFGPDESVASDPRAGCRVVGRDLGENVFRCTFGVRDRAFRYRGSARVYPFLNGEGDVLYTLDYRWYRGRCGAFPGGSPHPGPYPYAIRTRNVKCPAARRWIWNWYARARPMPAAYSCSLRSTPATARCLDATGRKFTFKYPE
jgi:hypothetical protein